MTRWWAQELAENSTSMRAATLEQLGGVKSIVERYLEDTLKELSPQQQRLAAVAFDFMVTPEGRKTAQTISELSGRPSVRDRGDPALLRQVIDKLQSARLLSPVPPPRGSRIDESYYEFAHDEVAKAAFKWREKRELAEAKTRLRRAVVTITALALLSLGLFAALAFVLTLKHNITEKSLTEKSQSVPSLLSLRPAEGLLLALETTAESWRNLDEVPLAIQANLKDAVEESRERVIIPSPNGPIVGLAMSPDGRFLAFNSGDGKIHFLNLTSSNDQEKLPGIPDFSRVRELQPPISGPVSVVNPRNPANPLAISPDGKLILTSSGDGTSLRLVRRDG